MVFGAGGGGRARDGVVAAVEEAGGCGVGGGCGAGGAG